MGRATVKEMGRKMSLEIHMHRTMEMCYSKYGSIGSNRGIPWNLLECRFSGPYIYPIRIFVLRVFKVTFMV